MNKPSAVKHRWTGNLRATRWLWSIKARLAMSFAAVVVLAVTAILIAQHGVSIIETTVFSYSRKVPLASPPPSAPVQTQTAPVPVEAPALLPSLERVHLALQARFEHDEPARTRELEEASRELSQRAAAYPGESATEGAVNQSARKLVNAYVQHVANAVKAADSRRAMVGRYRDNLTALEGTLAQAIDGSFKILGRLVARQSLIKLTRSLQTIKSNSAVLNAVNFGAASDIDKLIASEGEFALELKTSREGLRRSQGLAWERKLSAGFEALTAARAVAEAEDQKLRGATSQLTQERGRISKMVPLMVQPGLQRDQAGSIELQTATPAPISNPASQPTPEERVERRISRTPAPEEQRARNWVVAITAIVLAGILALSISTIQSIVRPVRRLKEATRRLGEGNDVKVERGGIRELDELAVAFNAMAAELISTRAAVIAHQATLETRVRERTQELRHQAEHDSLTQLPNRRLLLERLNVAVQLAAEAEQRVGVFFIDLDNFKNINDGMGHEIGDQVLLSVSQRLAETAAPFGLAARLGGDEFTILYPAASSVEAIASVGEVILRAFQRPLTVGDREMTMSASVGSSIFPDHAGDAETLLRAADAALFRAKALGRSQLHMFSPDLVEAAHTKFVVEQGLRRALDQGEFELVYQPEVELATLEPTLVEALLRWRTPDGRLLTPEAFLSVAEESGLIADLSDWVLRTTIAAASTWFHGAWPEVRIAINVSPRQLFDARFVSRIEELLHEYRLPPHCIEIELTENVLQTGVTTIDALRRLRACGIAIALDDFGTGYSSFASLEVLPLTRVKLDRSLVASIDTKSPSRAIATSIIGLCRSLNFEVTAEGVERPEQLAMLIEHGATHIQGYLLSRPVSGDNLLSELGALRGRLESLLLTMPPSVKTILPQKVATPAPVSGARRQSG